VADGALAEGNLAFSVHPTADSELARFELRAETADGRTFAVQPIEVPVEEP
jgi:hypothetical protein